MGSNKFLGRDNKHNCCIEKYKKCIALAMEKNGAGIEACIGVQTSDRLRSFAPEALGIWIGATRAILGVEELTKVPFRYKKDKKLYAKFSKNSFPFLANIFRKEFYNENITLGDDFERPIDILNKGYKVLVKEDESFPRMIAAYSVTRFKDIAKQKERTALARDQVFNKYGIKINLFNFYLPLFFYSLKNLNKINNAKGRFAFFVWLTTFGIGTLKNKIRLKKKSTKEGWLMRAKR